MRILRRASGRSEINEVLKKLQADLLAFFGVKLRRINVVAPDGGGEGLSVNRACGDDGGIERLRKKAVDEIDVAAAGNIAEQRAIRLGQLDLVPADLRDLQTGLFGEAHDPARENPQAGGATVEFVALLEQGLVADTNAEKRAAGADEFARGFEHFLFLKGVDAVVECADTGQHHGLRIGQFTGLAHDTNFSADLQQRLLDAAQVAGAVINQSNHAQSVIPWNDEFNRRF